MGKSNYVFSNQFKISGLQRTWITMDEMESFHVFCCNFIFIFFHLWLNLYFGMNCWLQVLNLGSWQYHLFIVLMLYMPLTSYQCTLYQCKWCHMSSSCGILSACLVCRVALPVQQSLADPIIHLAVLLETWKNTSIYRLKGNGCISI